VNKSPVCRRLCSLSWECFLNVLPHTSHVVSWRFTMCAASCSRLGNVASHFSHPKSSMRSGCAWRQCFARSLRDRVATTHKLHAKGRTSSHARVVARCFNSRFSKPQSTLHPGHTVTGGGGSTRCARGPSPSAAAGAGGRAARSLSGCFCARCCHKPRRLRSTTPQSVHEKEPPARKWASM
jgi:hypothetical protein